MEDHSSEMKGTSSKIPQFIAAGTATLGAFAMGMVLGWSSPVQQQVENGDAYDFDVTADDFSWIGSVVPLGAAVACVPTGIFVKLIGRKNTMLYISLPFLIGWIFILWPAAVEMLIVGRFITGFCGGIFCVASPLYISEIAETKIRGLLSSFYQLMICVGIEVSYIIGAFAPAFWLSFTSAIVTIIFAVSFFFMPETPQYLLLKNRPEDARKALQWFRGPNYDPENELDEMKKSVEESSKNKSSIIDMLKNPLARKGMLIMIGLMAFQQLSGINAVIFYSNDIFAATGGDISPEISTIIVGGVLALATIPPTLLVDIAGRKLLLLLSAVVMAIFITILGFYFFFQTELQDQGWLPLTTLIIYFISFSVGAGPVVWIIGAEIFAPEIVGIASSVGATSNWLIAFLVTKFYGDIADQFGNYTTFWFFGVCCVLGAVHIVLFVPETKGKNFDEISKDLAGNKSE